MRADRQTTGDTREELNFQASVKKVEDLVANKDYTGLANLLGAEQDQISKLEEAQAKDNKLIEERARRRKKKIPPDGSEDPDSPADDESIFDSLKRLFSEGLELTIKGDGKALLKSTGT